MKMRIACACGAAIITLAGGVTGCSKNRPLNVIRSDADALMYAKRYDRAEADYATYLTRKPEENAVRVQLAKAQLAQGKAKEAAENLHIALDVDPLNDEIVDACAQALYESRDPEALTAFVNRAASERGRVKDYARVAKYMQAIGHPDEAHQALLTAAKLDGGKSLDVQMALAGFYKSMGDSGRQVRRLRMAYFLAPENQQVLDAIRDAGEIAGPSFALAPVELTMPQVSAEPQ